MELSVPLDNGFLRRECPHCEREFKWFADPNQEPSNEEPPTHYYCPYCGEPAGVDEWWTKPQLEQIQAIALGDAARQINQELHKLERSTRGGLVQLKVDSGIEEPTPGVLDEPSDMIAIESPCHPEEPIKVMEEWAEPLHCLVCGEIFSPN